MRRLAGIIVAERYRRLCHAAAAAAAAESLCPACHERERSLTARSTGSPAADRLSGCPAADQLCRGFVVAVSEQVCSQCSGAAAAAAGTFGHLTRPLCSETSRRLAREPVSPASDAVYKRNRKVRKPRQLNARRASAIGKRRTGYHESEGLIMFSTVLTACTTVSHTFLYVCVFCLFCVPHAVLLAAGLFWICTDILLSVRYV